MPAEPDSLLIWSLQTRPIPFLWTVQSVNHYWNYTDSWLENTYELWKHSIWLRRRLVLLKQLLELRSLMYRQFSALNQHYIEEFHMRLHLAWGYFWTKFIRWEMRLYLLWGNRKSSTAGRTADRAGVAVFNVETVHNVYRAVEKKQPVTDKYVSVVAEVSDPVTVRVPWDVLWRKW